MTSSTIDAMSMVGGRNRTISTAKGYNLPIFVLFFVSVVVLLLLSACQPKSSLESVSGDVQVLIPKPDTSPKKYHLDVVTLKGVQSLKEVRGEYVQFIYSPGDGDGGLIGGAPRGRFSRNERGIFLPLDLITTQMSAIYFHLQNLIDLNSRLGLADLTRKPFQVGLEVKKPGINESFERNNAFYDGQSDSMLFLPNSTQDLALYLNAGVIAHEFFHSIFFKKVLGAVIQSSNKKFTTGATGPGATATGASNHESTRLFNLVWLRGLNEGLADFWGWAYTDDPDFMGLSLAHEIESRTLNVRADEIGSYQRQIDIRNQVAWATSQGQRGQRFLNDFIYTIGTPFARFLKRMVLLESADPSASSEAKTKWLELVVAFLSKVHSESLESFTQEKPTELLAGRLFQFVAEQSKDVKLLNQSQCDDLLKYLHYDSPSASEGGLNRYECQVSDTHGGVVALPKKAIEAEE